MFLAAAAETVELYHNYSGSLKSPSTDSGAATVTVTL